MNFYYSSTLSVLLLGIAYVALALLFGGIAYLTRNVRRRKIVLIGVAAVFLVLPVSEELWIAWNFGQACKGAGTTISRKVRVDGFYDATSHWWRQLSESNYQFVESREENGTFWRVERNGTQLRHYRIEHPTARYWFSISPGKRIAHKVFEQQSEVTDHQTGAVLGRYIRVSREAPWYFIGLDRPNLGCDGPAGGPHSKHSFLIYREVLIPNAAKVGDNK